MKALYRTTTIIFRIRFLRCVAWKSKWKTSGWPSRWTTQPFSPHMEKICCRQTWWYRRATRSPHLWMSFFPQTYKLASTVHRQLLEYRTQKRQRRRDLGLVTLVTIVVTSIKRNGLKLPKLGARLPESWTSNIIKVAEGAKGDWDRSQAMKQQPILKLRTSIPTLW